MLGVTMYYNRQMSGEHWVMAALYGPIMSMSMGVRGSKTFLNKMPYVCPVAANSIKRDLCFWYSTILTNTLI